MSQQRKTYSKSPEGDQARAMEEANAGPPTAWQRVRLRYPDDVREVVDAMVASGGLSLADIEAIEYAEHTMIQRDLEEDRANGTPNLVARKDMASLALQCRKHLRTIRLAMSPIQTPNTMKHQQPASVAERRARRKAPDRTDTGDELVN